MKKTITYVIIAAVVAVVGWGVYHFFFSEKPSLITLQKEAARKGDVTTEVTATGSVQPVDEVEVGTQVSGIIRKIYVDFNSQVKKGQLLAELDKVNLQEAVVNAQANYSSALNELNYYQQNYNRQKQLYDAQVISRQDYEQASYQYTNAKATVTQRLTALNQAKTNLGYANIYAPIDGIILSREVEEGQTVAAQMSAPALFKIAKDLTKMQVEVNVDEADIGQVKVGQRVSFTVDSYPNEEFSGVVKQVRLSPTTSSNVVTYTVIVEAENPDEKLKPGLTATIAIYTSELRDVLIIPAKAINFTPDAQTLAAYYQQQHITAPEPKGGDRQGRGARGGKGKHKQVWTIDSKGILTPKAITIGSSDGINVEVTEGLNAGDEVVTALAQDRPVQLGSSDSNNNGEKKSPFMQGPPRRNNSKAK